jgi:sporulation protein YlmC with PRC-barrel domain
MRVSDERLRGKVVIGADGQAVGEIVGFLFDTEAWRVDSLAVRLRKDAAARIGARRGVFHTKTLEIPIRLVQSMGDAMVLSVPVDGLRMLLGEGEESAHAP